MTRLSRPSFWLGLMVVSALGAMWVPVALAADERTPAPLAFKQRVACVERVEDVYWAHRLWPESNPGVKPARAEIVSKRQIAANVESSLLYEAALNDAWGESLTPQQIQAEMDRIAKETLHPELLEDVFAAFDHDPYLVAECYVRPRLAERRLRDRFSTDPEIHAETRDAAESILISSPWADELEDHGATVSELVWRVDEPGARTATPAGATVHELLVSPSELAELAERIEGQFGDLQNLVGAGFSSLVEINGGFVAISVRDVGDRSVEIKSVTWPKMPFEAWFDKRRPRLRPAKPHRANYTLPAIQAKSICADNSWGATSTTGAPGNHSFNVTVWTGAEMIVWGGGDWPGINTGGRYSLATNSWTATSTSGAPSARQNLAGVWTGTEMVVWGGVNWPTYLNTGGRYNPTTNSWTATSTTGAPVARSHHTAVWTGTEMIVWGGNDNSSHMASGGRYNPAANTWSATSTTGAPAARRLHTAIWTGAEMIIWGGSFGAQHYDGARYSPATDSWAPVSTTDAPALRDDHTAVWTGTEMIVWGGYPITNTGGRYDPATDTWSATSTSGAPSERYFHTAVWTGTEMIVWGGKNFVTGKLDTGGRYDPAVNGWGATSTTGAPAPRELHSAAWPGATPKMIVWGGWDDSGPLTTGGILCVSGFIPYDFGDAPDPTYPTLITSDGASHRLGTTLYLGSTVDPDDDGQPAMNADGDDGDGTDDEDGVAFTSIALPGGTGGVDVEASEAGVLNAWIDFNADGDWGDAGEQIFTDEALTPGINPLTFSVPAGAAVDVNTVARFRVDSAGGLLPTGSASSGEVEDHLFVIPEVDFGDSPDPAYPTLLASDGARHVIDGTTYLGTAVDADADGQPNANADGDDNDAQGDDEDGVSFTTLPVAGEVCNVQVTASTAGVVNAWMDYNADGDWSDAGEQIFVDLPLVPGPNPLVFTVPASAVTGTTFARFRFGSQPGLQPTGLAPDGEVEDYQISVALPMDMVLSSTTIDSTVVYESCNSITLGPALDLQSPAIVTLRTGGSVVFFNGFTVGTGVQLTVDSTQPDGCP